MLILNNGEKKQVITEDGQTIVAIELNEEEMNWKRAQWRNRGKDELGQEYDVILYLFSCTHCELALVYVEPDITAEDLMEWQAASCGMEYNDYIRRW